MELREYCTYRNDRINSDELNTHNYISTENLLPNKGGITEATSIPTGNVVRYDKGNILISNIRPYFKKIWLADKSGGCSADVLCIQSNDKVTSKFLYYLLSQQSFFDYVMAGAKGCKMPRGDKSHIMEWNVNIPDIDEQKRIADFLSSLDDKIELNRQINDNLEQQAQALFKSWFVDFEPFKDGEFVDSELGMIPKGWEVTNLGNVTTECKEKVGNREDVKVLSPVTTGELLLSEEYFTKQVFSDSIAKYIVVKPTEFAYNPARVNIGSLGINTFDFDGCVSPVYVVFRTEPKYHHFFNLFRKRESFKTEINSRAIGGVRQTLNYKDFSLISLIYPPIDVIEDFNEIYSSLLHQIDNSKEENKKLSQLRDTLLPRLISGELKINEINC